MRRWVERPDFTLKLRLTRFFKRSGHLNFFYYIPPILHRPATRELEIKIR